MQRSIGLPRFQQKLATKIQIGLQTFAFCKFWNFGIWLLTCQQQVSNHIPKLQNAKIYRAYLDFSSKFLLKTKIQIGLQIFAFCNFCVYCKYIFLGSNFDFFFNKRIRIGKVKRIGYKRIGRYFADPIADTLGNCIGKVSMVKR